MNRAERAQQAARLRAQGLTGEEIATRMGISRSYAYELLSDPDGSASRARRRRYEQPCVDCGLRTDGSNGIRDEPRCNRCASIKRGADHKVWTREAILAAVRSWADLHGEPPAVADWNPYQALRSLHDPARVRRFEASGGRDRWPSARTVFNEFGSWRATIEAAGFEPRVPHGGGGNQLRRRRAREAVTA